MASWFDTGNIDWSGLGSGLVNLWSNYQGMQNANRVNNAVQQGLQQNQAATSNQIADLERQIAANRAAAQAEYDRSRGDVESQNAALLNDINTMTGNLTALNDPNSPYMQMARQAIERKDAAAGRNSQWGQREVELAATLADYVGKYAPGLQNAITNARNQINANNQGLANLFSTINNPADRTLFALADMLRQQQTGVNAMNTTGRQAGSSATNNMTGLLNSGIKALGGLSSLFGGSGGNTGITDLWGGNTGLGLGGWGTLGSNLYGSYDGGWGFGDLGLGTGMGFTGGGLDNDFLGLAGTGSLGSGLDFSSGGFGYGLGDYGPSWGSGWGEEDLW